MTDLTLPQALLVDQDGTTVDSEPIWDAVECQLARDLGGVLTPEIRQTFIGGPLPDTADKLIEITGTTRSSQDIQQAILDGVATTIETDGVNWMPGVVDFFNTMVDLGLPIAIVTASFRRIANAVLADCPVDGIHTVVAGDEVPHPKPAPDGYLEAARRLGVDIAQCVAIEDSLPGMTSAVTARARVIIVPGHQRLDLLPGVSRVTSISDITPEFLHRVMNGDVVDMLATHAGDCRTRA